MGAALSICLIYLSIPFFFNYEKTIIKNKVCKDYNVDCLIKGPIKYNFIPSPRIKIKNLIIKDFNNKNKVFATWESNGAIFTYFLTFFAPKYFQ